MRIRAAFVLVAATFLLVGLAQVGAAPEKKAEKKASKKKASKKKASKKKANKKKPSTGEVHIEMTGFRNNKGVARIAFFLDKKGFPEKKHQAYRRKWSKIKKNKATIILKDIPAGDFAISGLHDEDMNDKMKKTLGLPREGYCISRNPSLKLRAPRFHEARLELKPGKVTKVHLKMKYL